MKGNTMSDISQVAEFHVEDDARWRAVVERDRNFDDQFVYAVQTTGVYCRPSCAARLPQPRNVRFYVSCAQAEQAGFRSCKRCKPNEPTLHQQHAAKITEVCRAIEAADEMPRLDELARRVQLSPHHFHRVFKGVTGVTPRAYAVANRDQRLHRVLVRADTSVTEALYEAGYNSSSRF